ncbi:hypothetical protein [Ketogulonicigenium vulgare]|uniref:Uncharacterized protein n=1 Tax=Ketogulonicigenium vulgare (strain WSH-001) TaxID=759362 RepID=F9YAH8_KETVW|nr:hypothetical protein [Ketogulonicigenium vulgare]ADO43215.1 conserved hypothetical protein [Ketogulonicigenium vulgare Y25]AEM41509.1 hypothetical protein KVU_1670 [Ketogulonicigenium vulgare WSH-001]ALJ81635.1 hypothetical protein KVH_10915 [Ketogulonicigenium vulgare]ANW34310.1 hypothetical protein KvSKV_10830 [Ketogulonicigenium vulgare]AOZ55251.1 hypothetical protein KVC_2246 [Ketogulonicigenium vulgare]
MTQDSQQFAPLGADRIADAAARVEAALSRIAGVLQASASGPLHAGHAADTSEQLAAAEGRFAVLEQQLAAQGSRLAEIDDELYRLRQSNAELRAVAEEMRGSLAANVADPRLINRAMEAEIAALQASRAADLAEVSAVIAGLRPLVANSARPSHQFRAADFEEQE